MNDRERAVWDAAYAAAFVARFRDAAAAVDGFDYAAKQTSSEEAITIADLAVARLREWKRDENPEAGDEVRPVPEYWK